MRAFVADDFSTESTSKPKLASPRTLIFVPEAQGRPLLFLAPMMDLTELPFWNLLDEYGGADYYYTPYFRVHATSRLDRNLLASIQLSPAGRRIVAQIIGEDIQALVRTAVELRKYPVAAVDLNLGCPAPIVCRKHVGGGLLRHLDRIDAILEALRESLDIPFTVKTRLGYGDHTQFEKLLGLFDKHNVDLVTIHARTVQDLYRPGTINYEAIRTAVQQLRCPVVANGDLVGAQQALEIMRQTGARGVMIGRGAIRNPWIFSQIRRAQAGKCMNIPVGRDVLDYLRRLYDRTQSADATELQQVKKMKKYVNFVGVGVESSGRFLHEIRRTNTRAEFFQVCECWLNHDQPMVLAPYPGLV